MPPTDDDAQREMLAKLMAQQRFKGLMKLRNEMTGAIDPAEGDFYRSDAYNTARAAEGVREYDDDKKGRK